MRVVSLLYHDVVAPGEFEGSGFPGGDAHIYKLELPEFRKHLAAIQAAVTSPPVLTFDDGGVSAHEYIAGELERLGWRAHFFMTTNWIGKPGFLSAAQLRDLRERGHSIGSHSCSHPARMSYCSREDLRQEWRRSVALLSDILGERIETASVPGGYFARNVAEEAADAGIRTLFTSEPQTQASAVAGCTILGRYTIQQGITAGTAAAIASGKALPRFRQFAYWNAKKLVKAAGGTSWLRARKWVLAR